MRRHLDITWEEVEIIINKITCQEDIELSEKHAYEKFKLRKLYNYGEFMSPKFVEYYKKYDVKQVDKNLCAIAKYKTIQESLEMIIKKKVSSFLMS